MGWLAGSTAAEGAMGGCGDVSVMDYESVALATTSVHDLSPLSPLSCSCLADSQSCSHCPSSSRQLYTYLYIH
jgi:hypothetical protein